MQKAGSSLSALFKIVQTFTFLLHSIGLHIARVFRKCKEAQRKQAQTPEVR